ncbi:shikimate kinase [Acetobacterium bakii]|uniref:Shikimate kinase n=1 Tax=Acetobacterium bakii TaxID=52689 RepID=A0A0L6TZM7_9FIRM|nr:shikimate kinase [Acetobacterium bakii]KNZ41698.1 hypothetical protein AKG39_10435 [Acetobacterium bakii]
MEIKQIERIALIGFMATGKSTIGPLLAERLGYVFIDTDELVEAAAKMKISEIFNNLGESVFREAEHDALKLVINMEKAVISTGGGIILFERNRKLLRTKTFVVNLTCRPETIFKRIQGDQTRPLLDTEDPLKRITLLMAERRKYYEDCDFQISTEDFSEIECCEKIESAYKKSKKRPVDPTGL